MIKHKTKLREETTFSYIRILIHKRGRNKETRKPPFAYHSNNCHSQDSPMKATHVKLSSTECNMCTVQRPNKSQPN